MRGYFNGLREMIRAPGAWRGNRETGPGNAMTIPIHTAEILTIPAPPGSFPDKPSGTLPTVFPEIKTTGRTHGEMTAERNDSRVEALHPVFERIGKATAGLGAASTPVQERNDNDLDGRSGEPVFIRASDPAAMMEKREKTTWAENSQVTETDVPSREMDSRKTVAAVAPAGVSRILIHDRDISAPWLEAEQIRRPLPDGDQDDFRNKNRNNLEDAIVQVLIKKGEAAVAAEDWDADTVQEKGAVKPKAKEAGNTPWEQSEPAGESWTVSIGAIHLMVEEPPRETKSVPATAAQRGSTPAGERQGNRNSDSRLRRHYLR